MVHFLVKEFTWTSRVTGILGAMIILGESSQLDPVVFMAMKMAEINGAGDPNPTNAKLAA